TTVLFALSLHDALPVCSTLAYRPAVYDRPLWRTAWRRLRRRPLQYLLFVLGVALGVAMMVSIDLASGSANRAFELSTSAVTGRRSEEHTSELQSRERLV